MADGYTTPQLPPQAQTGLPGAAAAASDITQAPPATDVLGPAAYGDKGWQQYQDLQRAGQQAPTPTPSPTPSLPGDPSASGLNYLLGGGGAAMPSPLLDLLGGTGTAMKYQNQVAQQQQQAVALQQKRQALAANGFAFLDSLRKQNVPLELRAPMIQQWAAQQGLPIDPIQSAYIAQWGNDPQKYEEHLLHQIQAGGPAADDAAQKWSELFSSDYNRMIQASDAVRKSKAETDLVVNRAADEARKAAGGVSTIKTEFQGQRAKAIEDLTNELHRAPTESEIQSRVGQIKAEEKTPPMTVQRAREQIASAQDVGKDLMTMLTDPKFDDATKSLGPSAAKTFGGVTVQPPSALLPDTGGLPSYSRLWSNYFVYGGKGNTDEENRLMQAIGYYQGTGFQGFLNGIRNEKVIRDIRAHLPSPLADKNENINRIKYLNTRYSDVLNEFAKGGQTVGQLAGEGTTPPSSGGTAPARVTTRAEVEALPSGSPYINPADGKTYIKK